MCYSAFIERVDANASILNKIKTSVCNFSGKYISALCGRHYYVIENRVHNTLYLRSEVPVLTTARKISYIILTLLVIPFAVCFVIKLVHRYSLCSKNFVIMPDLPPFPPFHPAPLHPVHLHPAPLSILPIPSSPQPLPKSPIELPKNSLPKVQPEPVELEDLDAVEKVLLTYNMTENLIKERILPTILMGLLNYPAEADKVINSLKYCISLIMPKSQIHQDLKNKIANHLRTLFCESQKYQKLALKDAQILLPLMVNIDKYGRELAKIAQKVGHLPLLVNALKDPIATLNGQLTNMSIELKEFYLTLYERDFSIMCQTFSHPEYPQDKILNFLKSLEPNEENQGSASGLAACPEGLGRSLEEIRNTINIPSKVEDMTPWLKIQYIEHVIQLMLSETHEKKKIWHIHLAGQDQHLTNQANAIIVAIADVIGDRLDLPKEMVEIAKKDSYMAVTSTRYQDIAAGFLEFCTPKNLEEFMLNRINSSQNDDGDLGLKDYRLHIVSTLTESVTANDIESARAEITKIILASDPEFKPGSVDENLYAIWKYCEDPKNCLNTRSKDVKLFDLNKKAIRKFFYELFTKIVY